MKKQLLEKKLPNILSDLIITIFLKPLKSLDFQEDDADVADNGETFNEVEELVTQERGDNYDDLEEK